MQLMAIELPDCGTVSIRRTAGCYSKQGHHESNHPKKCQLKIHSELISKLHVRHVHHLTSSVHKLTTQSRREYFVTVTASSFLWRVSVGGSKIQK